MAFVAAQKSSDLNERKAIGRAHLEANQVEDALRVYARILRDYPDDVDAYLFLGDCYLADGDADTALLLYSQALEYVEDHPEVERRISLARARCIQRWGSSDDLRCLRFIQSESIPTNPQAILELLQTLTRQPTPVTEAEVVKATRMLDEIIYSPHPAKAVAERLDEIDELIPALLELNIRQARADGRPDLAQALQNLLDNIQLQKDSASAEQEVPRPHAAATRLPSDLRILFLSSTSQEALLRQGTTAQALRDLGCQTAVLPEIPRDRANQFDVVVAHRPHSDSRLMESLAACAAARMAVILDLDANFEQIPVDHPEYEVNGLSTPARAKDYAAAMLLADAFRVPCESLADCFSTSSRPVQVIPEGWTRQNDLWKKASGSRHTFNLGWISSPGQLEDLFQVRRIILRVMREFPQVRVVIGGDAQAYKLFDTLPEARRLFLPTGSQEDYPYLLGQMDVLMVPLRNIPFHRTISDRRLMEAGVRGIPWIASPVPAFTDWEAGGLIAHTVDEWHTYLRQLVMDAGLRATLSQAGRQRAEIREMGQLAPAWLSFIEKTIAAKAAGLGRTGEFT